MRMAAILSWTLLRRGLPALAVYALVLQAFLAGAAPAAAFDPAHTLCAESSAAPGTPVPDRPAGHDLACVCIAACAMPHAPVAIAPTVGAPTVDRISTETRIAWGAPDSISFPKRLTGPGARGPPRG